MSTVLRCVCVRSVIVSSCALWSVEQLQLWCVELAKVLTFSKVPVRPVEVPERSYNTESSDMP